VLSRAGVLRLERGRERGHRLAVSALEQAPLPTLDLEQVPEVTGVEEELLLRLLLSAGPVRGAMQPAGEALDDRQQLERAERLEHEGVRSDLARDQLVRDARAGEEHDRDVARLP
jgi:hypothetical protein